MRVEFHFAASFRARRRDEVEAISPQLLLCIIERQRGDAVKRFLAIITMAQPAARCLILDGNQ